MTIWILRTGRDSDFQGAFSSLETLQRYMDGEVAHYRARWRNAAYDLPPSPWTPIDASTWDIPPRLALTCESAFFGECSAAEYTVDPLGSAADLAAKQQLLGIGL